MQVWDILSWSEEASATPKTTPAIASGLGFSPDLHIQPMAEVSTHLGGKTKRNRAELNWKLPPCLVDCIDPEEAITWAAEGENSSTILLRCR